MARKPRKKKSEKVEAAPVVELPGEEMSDFDGGLSEGEAEIVQPGASVGPGEGAESVIQGLTDGLDALNQKDPSPEYGEAIAALHVALGALQRKRGA